MLLSEGITGLKLIGLKLLCVGENISYFSELCFKDVMTQKILITWYLWYVLRYCKLNSLTLRYRGNTFCYREWTAEVPGFILLLVGSFVFLQQSFTYVILSGLPYISYNSNLVFKCFCEGISNIFPLFSLITKVQINPFSKH